MSAPKISVIIPLYNAEKYIRECLISVLASKFKDYEILIVDDCSTDNSVAEVKKLLPHFDGRLKLIHTEKNSGGAGIPRNVGIKNASGKYITFIDNDDMILPDALGYFTLLADMYEADVVYAEKYFNLDDNQPLTAENLKPAYCIDVEELTETPVLETADLRERIKRDMAGKFFILPWGKCYRRDFLTENNIYFPQMPYAEDVTFCFKCLCLAKNYLHIPHMINVHRVLRESAAQKTYDLISDCLRPWLKILFTNMNILGTFMAGLEFFGTNPDCRYEVFKYYFDVHVEMIENLFSFNLSPHAVQGIFFLELQNPEFNLIGRNLVTAYLFAEQILKK